MRIVVFGDSITQGFDDLAKGGWVGRLFTDLSAKVRGEAPIITGVFNLGVSGDTTGDVRKRIESELQARARTDMVTILDIGGSDCTLLKSTEQPRVSFADFSANYQQLIATAQTFGQVVCLGLHDTDPVEATLSPNNTDFSFDPAVEQSYDQEIALLAEAAGVVYVPMQGLLARDFTALTYDGEHPSTAGHQLIYKRVKEALVKHNIV